MSSFSRLTPRTAATRKRTRLGRWALLAALIHVEIGFGLWLAAYFFAPRDVDRAGATATNADDSIEFGTIDEETSRRILAEMEQADERREKQEAEETAKKEEEATKAPGQVVEMARPQVDERPKDARFVAEYDSKVEKQTRKFGELNPKATQGTREGADPIMAPAQPAQAAQPAQKASPGRSQASPVLAMRTPGPDNPLPPALRPPGTGPEAVAGQSPETEPGPPNGDGRDLSVGIPRPPKAGGGAGQPDLPGAAALLPTPQQITRAIGSGTSDHLLDIDEGDETALNAKKWKFASFFNRVKRQVRTHWKPAQEYHRRDPSFRIYGQRDRYTLLRVQLKADGSLSNVALETPSGVEFLDDEAIEAFKQAQPFPNPPHQLIEDGAISFRFGFYFEIGGFNPKFKVFKYNDF